MNHNPSSGPSATATWQEIEIAGGGGAGVDGPRLILLLPDADNRNGAPDNLFYYLPKIPRLATDTTSEPVLSLTLELSRMPNTTDATILPLIRRGWLALTLTFGLPQKVHAALEASVGVRCRPLFARSVHLELRANEAVLAAAAETSVHLGGVWATVYDYLATKVGPDG